MSSVVDFGAADYLTLETANEIFLQQTTAQLEYLTKVEAANTYLTEDDISAEYVAKNTANNCNQDFSLTVKSNNIDKVNVDQNGIEFINTSNETKFRVQENETLIKDSNLTGNIDIRGSDGFQVDTNTFITAQVLYNWYQIFNYPYLEPTNQGIIFHKRPYIYLQQGFPDTVQDQILSKREIYDKDPPYEFSKRQKFNDGIMSQSYYNILDADVNLFHGNNKSYNYIIAGNRKITIGSAAVQADVSLKYTFQVQFPATDNSDYIPSNGWVQSAINYKFGANNIWTGTNTYNTFLPTSTVTPTQPAELVTKTYVDSISGTTILPANNTWTGTNTYNTYLPTSTVTPTQPNEFVTKTYADSTSSNLLSANNVWTGTNFWTNAIGYYTPILKTSTHNIISASFPTNTLIPTSSNVITNANTSYVSIGSINVDKLFKSQIDISTPIAVARNWGFPYADQIFGTVSETILGISCNVYKDGIFWQNVSVNISGLPVTKSYTKNTLTNQVVVSYSQFFFNVSLSFVPVYSVTSSTYDIRFSINYSYSDTGSPPPNSTSSGYYVNTNLSGTNTSFIIANSSAGSNYTAVSYTVIPDTNNVDCNGTVYMDTISCNNVDINQNVEVNGQTTFTHFLPQTLNSITPTLTNQLVTKGYTDSSFAKLADNNTWSGTNDFNILKVSGHTTSNYDSNWFPVTVLSTYPIQHNLNWSFPNPPFIRMFYSDTNDPQLGTTSFLELPIGSSIGTQGNTNNYTFGCNQIKHINANRFILSTSHDGVFYSSGGDQVTTQPQNGYYRVICYK